MGGPRYRTEGGSPRDINGDGTGDRRGHSETKDGIPKIREERGPQGLEVEDPVEGVSLLPSGSSGTSPVREST